MTISEPTPKSSGELDEPVRRFEVYTGAGRRRDWSAEDKARIVSESFEPGARVSAVARRHAWGSVGISAILPAKRFLA